MLQSNKKILFRSLNYVKKLSKKSISGSKTALNRDIMFFNLRPKFDGFVPIKEVLKFKKKSDLTFTSSYLYPTVRNSTTSNEQETKEFMDVFPDILRDLSDIVNDQNKTEISSWYQKVLEYNVPTGKKNRGLSLVSTYKLLEKPTNLTNENVKLAIILGWCTEMLQAHFLVLDDIMDSSQTRRGKSCWYKIENIGFSAINDALLIENGIFALLKRHFRSHLSYSQMFEVFKDVNMKTCIGQKLDLTKINGEKPNFSLFTSDRYQLITQYKTAYYSFQLPVSLALLMCNIVDEQIHQQAKNILLEIGHFFQVQDDFLDCFGNPDVLGKIGSDIREGKCTWLAVEALKRSSEAQKKVMYEHYGIKDDTSVEKIRNLYEDLDLPKAYAIYEDRTYTLIHNMIQRVINDLLPHEIFYKFIEKIYRREC